MLIGTMGRQRDVLNIFRFIDTLFANSNHLLVMLTTSTSSLESELKWKLVIND